ncbi:MAG: hypothetical protein PHV87_06280, partial [Bacilli bacterium]|nr:hypothetical protein [Bacilli bacterium]
MNTIIFDTSSPYLYLAFSSGDKVIYEKFIEGKNRHSENLLLLIEEGLNQFNFTFSNFKRICLGIGPGSY